MAAMQFSLWGSGKHASHITSSILESYLILPPTRPWTSLKSMQVSECLIFFPNLHLASTYWHDHNPNMKPPWHAPVTWGTSLTPASNVSAEKRLSNTGIRGGWAGPLHPHSDSLLTAAWKRDILPDCEPSKWTKADLMASWYPQTNFEGLGDRWLSRCHASMRSWACIPEPT